MSIRLLNERELNFQLYEVLDTEALLQRPRYAEHDRAVFDATLETARAIATDYLAPHNQKGDANEPTFDGEKVTLIPETKLAWAALSQAGFHAAHHDAEYGGLQLPEVILRTCVAYFSAANGADRARPGFGFGRHTNLRASERRWELPRFWSENVHFRWRP